MEWIYEWKGAVTAVLAGLTALWGWFGWLVLLWLCCLLFDYITGSLAAARRGEWSSATAREGIWHKLGSIVAVMVAAGADVLLSVVIGQLPEAPLSYSSFLCPLVVVWYTLTELGSITENAVRLGAPVPEFLRKALKIPEKFS